MKIIYSMIFVITWALSNSWAYSEVSTILLDVEHGDRTNPIKVYLPETNTACPLIIYSHGLGGSRETKAYLLEYWTAAGFVCVSVQHPGSDESVWKDAGRKERFTALRKAAGAEQFLNRCEDIPAVLDQLEKWNTEETHPLCGKMDLDRIGMSGHSFGAVTGQAMIGALYAGQSRADDRFDACLLMSPSPVKGRLSQEKAFHHVNKPVLCMTGTEDRSIITPDTAYPERQSVYDALPPGQKYMLVFDGGKHDLFSGPKGVRQRLLPEHKAIQEVSLMFWQSTLLNDENSKRKLKDYQPVKPDLWFTK
jgi:predicted dienelactone hydrolase